jgi:hypothetical protein
VFPPVAPERSIFAEIDRLVSISLDPALDARPFGELARVLGERLDR